MTVFHFEKKVKHANLQKCTEDIEKKIMTLCPHFKNGINGHLSINHGKPSLPAMRTHEIWVSFYTSGKHEGWSQGKIIKTTFNETQEKYHGDLPLLKELKNL